MSPCVLKVVDFGHTKTKPKQATDKLSIEQKSPVGTSNNRKLRFRRQASTRVIRVVYALLRFLTQHIAHFSTSSPQSFAPLLSMLIQADTASSRSPIGTSFPHAKCDYSSWMDLERIINDSSDDDDDFPTRTNISVVSHDQTTSSQTSSATISPVKMKDRNQFGRMERRYVVARERSSSWPSPLLNPSSAVDGRVPTRQSRGADTRGKTLQTRTGAFSLMMMRCLFFAINSCLCVTAGYLIYTQLVWSRLPPVEKRFSIHSVICLSRSSPNQISTFKTTCKLFCFVFWF